MASHSTYTDARGGYFNNVGRDQNVYQTINVTITGSTPELALPRYLGDCSQLPTSIPAISPRKEVITGVYLSQNGSAVKVASGLIEKIEQLVVDRTEPPDSYRGLQEQLGSLHLTLTLAGLAIKAYKSTPLGRSLASSINPEVERCCVVLQELFDGIKTCRRSLFATYIRDLWYNVWWSGWDEDEFASFRMNLLEIQKALVGFLMALHSYVPFISHARLSADMSFRNKCEVLHGWRLQTNYALVTHPSMSSVIY
jgi:hypothetical protein